MGSQVIVFGSAAIGLRKHDSDFDIFCVGRGKRFKNRELDIVWKGTRDVQSRRWLGSELAVHIANCGVWIHGHDNWSAKTKVSDAAIEYKRRLIFARARALERAWKTIGRAYRLKHVVKLRRDMQRFEFLLRREAVPPTPVLDRIWSKHKSPRGEILRTLKRNSDSRLLTQSHVSLFREFWRSFD